MRYSYLAGSVVLWAVGAHFALSQRAAFRLGGNFDAAWWQSDHYMPANATGRDAVAIGVLFIALGVVNLAQGVRGQRRIAVFWTGVALLAATAVYGVVRLVT